VTGKRLDINLASQPFRRDRSVYVFSIAISGVLFLLLVTLVALAIQQRGQADDTRAAISRLEKTTATQQAEVTRLEALLRQNENAAVLDRGLFLNALIQRKAVSWTRIFSDLSNVMPGDVRLVAVRPQILGNNQVVLDMTLAASTSRPVVNFLMKLEQSPVFGATTVLSWRPPSQNESVFVYRVTANYAQKL
jgi:type IV pilus assembly protein PilN